MNNDLNNDCHGDDDDGRDMNQDGMEKDKYQKSNVDNYDSSRIHHYCCDLIIFILKLEMEMISMVLRKTRKNK